MFDDDAARRALRTLTDDAAPPATTTLGEVVRRGKRRLFVQRAGAVAGVVAVVAAIGVGTILLRPGDSGDGVRAASPPTSTSSSSRLPGWTPVPIPANSRQGGDSCLQPFVQLPPESGDPLPAEHQVRDAYLRAAEGVVGSVAMADTDEWPANSAKHVGRINLAIPMNEGTGQLMLEVSRYGGAPEQIADASVTVYGNCVEPLRRTLADGTIMQLYPLDDLSQPGPTQHLQIYEPSGMTYVITSAGWSGVGVTPPRPAGKSAEAPVTEAELVGIGQRLVINMR